MYTITDSSAHQTKTQLPPPFTSLADHTGSLSLIQHDVDIGVSPRFTRFALTLHCTLTHLPAHTIMPNRLHSQQTALDCLLGIFFRFLLHTLRNPPHSYLFPRLYPHSIVCFRLVYVLSVWTSSFVLFTMTSEIQQQQQLDTPVAPEAATGVTILRKRHLVSRSGTRCYELQHPILLLPIAKLVHLMLCFYQILFQNTYLYSVSLFASRKLEWRSFILPFRCESSNHWPF